VETAKHRAKVYFEQTAPLIEHYQQQGVLDEIDGARSISEVREAMLDAVRRRLAKI
jgi:adenylate kinase